MSEFIKTDVGDFFVSRTKNFEKSPPDSMWESIENQVPQYSATNPLLKYFVGGIGLSVIIFSLFLVFYQFGNEPKNQTSKIVSNNTETTNGKIDESNNISNKTIVTINSEKENKVAEVNSQKSVLNNNVQETNNNTTPRKRETINTTNNNTEKSIKYSINATGLKNVSEISFENEKKENIIVLQKPIPNAFGFYDIDISKLPLGTYNIFITIDGNKKLHKTETFK